MTYNQALAHITRHLEHKFPRPKVDPEWLQGCYEWLIEQPGAIADSQKFLEDAELQLLQSHFQDSMLAGTGLPIHITQPDHKDANTRLGGSAVLVEIAAMTEISHSAYQLDQIRTVREDRIRAGQADEGEGEGDLEVEGEGPMPKYPRGMLKFELSDGITTLSAIEYRSIPEIVLGKTPLGFKMLLKNPVLRHGIAFLEPNTVELVGHQTADRECLQSTEFARGLRVRMGLPLLPDNEGTQDITPQAVETAAAPVRSPLREISPPPESSFHSTYNDDVNMEPRRRKLPPTNTTVVPTPASTASSSTLVPSTNNSTVISHYFSSPAGTSSSTSNTQLNGLHLGLTTAQSSQAPAKDQGDDEEDLFSHFDNIDFFDGVDENLPASSSTRPPVVTSPPASASRSTVARPLALEESVEIVSFTPSQAALTGSQSKAGFGEGKNTGTGKAPSSSLRHSPSICIIEVSTKLNEPVSSTRSPTALVTSPDVEGVGGRNQVNRPIRPLPKTRTSFPFSDSSQSQPRRSQSQPKSQPQPSSSRPQSQAGKEVIDVDSSSPKVARQKSLPKGVEDDEDIEVLGGTDFNAAGDIEFGDDDEEQDDKENMPVMTRHVRRKVITSDIESSSPFSVGGLFDRSDSQTSTNRNEKSRSGTGHVIELSDED